MFKNLFKRRRPQCPVSLEAKQWIEARFGWLIGEFGWDRLRNRDTVLPAPEFFPEQYQGSEDDAQAFFDRTCQYMDLDPSQFELCFHTTQPDRESRFNPRFFKEQTDWAGLYDAQQQKTKIWLETSVLKDPQVVVATIAHELAHAHLLGQKRMSAEEADMELVTDLATVFWGMGIFNANTAFREVQGYESVSYFWHGYLSPRMWSYALALYAWVRDEPEPEWLRYLNLEVKSQFRQSIAYFMDAGGVELFSGGPADGIPPIDAFASELPGLRREADLAEDEYNSEADAASIEMNGDLFTDGVFLLQNGEWEKSLEAFTAALLDDPDDGEIYEQRAWTYLELGRVPEAVVDAEKAVLLNPENYEVYRARGVAYFQSQQFECAIEDLSKYLKEEDIYACDSTRAAKAYYFRGLAYAAKSEHEKAVADYSNAIRCRLDWPDPYEARSNSYEMLGKSELAERDRSEAVRYSKM